MSAIYWGGQAPCHVATGFLVLEHREEIDEDALEREAALYRELRPAVFGVAYRMVGSVTEADDLVQEAFLRFHRTRGLGRTGSLAVDEEGRVATAMVLEIADGAIRQIRAIVNPDKLGHLGPVVTSRT